MVTGRRWRSRLALGLAPTPRSGLMLLLVGVALGPQGLRVLSEPVLTSLDPAVSAALAALGMLVGLGLNVRPWIEGRLLAIASLDALTTGAIVGIGMLATLWWTGTAPPTLFMLALMLGVCAGPSSTPVEDREGEAPEDPVLRVGDLNDVLPILVSVAAVIWSRPEPAVSTLLLLLQGAAVTVVIAYATRLLVTQTSSENEQRVFVIGALLLLGGAAAHVSLSTLWLGLVAGVFFSATGGAALDRVTRDVRYLQHPLTVLLLLVAGARLQFSVVLLALLLVYAALRVAGKLLGGWLATRASRSVPGRYGLFVSAPGVVGIAIALDVLQTGVDAGSLLLTIVVAGSLAADLLSWPLTPLREVRA